MPDLQRTLKDMAEECLNEGKHLTKWEESFLESIIDKLERSCELSGREREILKTIHDGKVG